MSKKTKHPDKTFAKKYGLKEKGKKIRISQKTKQFIECAFKEGELIVEKGKHWAKTTSLRIKKDT
ncbi:MAG: hypothetical protein ABFQ53_02030 [Patescibacteria group bacterium]